ncbi:MAG: amidohydrolase family protein [Candidatus Thiodiazotropha sp.]
MSFDRLYYKLAAKGLGVEPAQLRANPYQTYIEAMAKSVKNSQIVDKTCLFGVDACFDDRGRETTRNKTVCTMNQDVLRVVAQYPDQFIPFCSINPKRTNALELIDEQVEKGCQGAKFLQNYWGIDLNEERWIPYYEKLKWHRLPLIIHIGSEYSISSHAAFERADMLSLPLATGVTVIAAHMGLGRFSHKLRPWKNLSRNPDYFDADYFRLLEMLKKHPNLYADISAILPPHCALVLCATCPSRLQYITKFCLVLTTLYLSLSVTIATTSATISTKQSVASRIHSIGMLR